MFLERQLRTVGEYKQAIAVLEQMSPKLDALPRTKGRQFNINRRLAINHLSIGDVERAEVYVKKNQALFNEFGGLDRLTAAQTWREPVIVPRSES